MQRGISLFIVLISLVTLSIAALAILRTVDTGALISGNLAFKRTTLAAANRYAESTAIPWIKINSSALDNAAIGYSPMLAWPIDATGNCVDADNPVCSSSAKINWNNNNCGGCLAKNTCAACLPASVATETDGYSSRYLIARVRDGNNLKPSALPKQSDSACQRAGEVLYGSGCAKGSDNVEFFRIFVKTIGPRNATVYTEQYVYF